MVGDPAGLPAGADRLRSRHYPPHRQGHHLPPECRRGRRGHHRRGQHPQGGPGPARVSDGEAPHRGGARLWRLAGVRAADGSGLAPDGASEKRGRRSDDGLFYVGNDGLSEDGAAHSRVLSDRPHHHRQVLARQHSRGSALDALGHRLGPGRVDLLLRALEHGRRHLHLGRARQEVRLRGDARHVRALPHHDLLRAADGLPHDGPGAAPEVPLPHAAPLPRRRRGNPEVIEAWREGTGHHIYEGYGQTESVLVAATFPATPWKPGSMGPTAPGHRIGIVDEEGRVLPRGEEGDLGILVKPERPVGMFQEYWKNAEATAKCHRGDWYITGDRSSMDEEGYLWFVGRADDVINSASYRIGPFEVESALVEHAAVAEAAVIGKPDALRGEIVKAFVVLAPGHTASDALAVELQEHVKTVTAPYKYPREIEFVVDLPKTISGKIRRTELRQLERERSQRTPSRPFGGE